MFTVNTLFYFVAAFIFFAILVACWADREAKKKAAKSKIVVDKTAQSC